jgi:benzoate membrane transport protein
MRISIIANALVAAFVGFGGTLALIVAAANALGATQAETASWVSAISLAVAVETVWLSWRMRMPVMAAWSTPGLALIAASQGITMAEGVGVFIFTAAALVVTGLVRPLMRAIAAIPMSVASGMLGGIITGIVVLGAKAAAVDPLLLLPLVAVYLLVRLWHPSVAVIAALVAGIAVVLVTGRLSGSVSVGISALQWTTPRFTPAPLIGLGLPLWLVTMASQNLSGLAVLRADGYAPEAGPIVTFTGLVSLITAPFNAHTTNLAAISASICTGPDTHPDPAKRWLTGPVYAAVYVVFAIFGASLVSLFSALPPGLIALVAGLAFLGPLGNALAIALKNEAERLPAVIAFAVTTSGVTVLAIGSAFWGLVAGLVVLGLERINKR